MRLGRQPLAARTRLTLWYAALLAGTLLVVGGLALWLVGRTLYANVDDLLRSKAAAVTTEIDVSKNRLTFEPPSSPNTRTPAVAVGLDLVRIWDRTGRAIYKLDGLAGTPPVEVDQIN